MGATVLTTDEQAGIAEFKASIERARAQMTPAKFAFQMEIKLEALRNGTVAKMKNAPRQEVIDAMIAVMVAVA